MRLTICATLVIGALAASQAIAQTARPAPKSAAHAHHAVEASRFGMEANYVSSQPQKGYSAETRHMTTCLATYRSYDPRTDRFYVRGVARRCEL